MSRRRIALYIALSIIPLVAALWIAGVDPNYILGNDVTANSAYVTGDVYLASAPVSGTVRTILVRTGDQVQQGQTLAYISAPAPADQTVSVVAPVKSPAAGTIVHNSILVGMNVVSGQTVETIEDMNSLYVVAAIDENSFAQVRPGESAEVDITALNTTFTGSVSQLSPDLSETTPRTSTGGVASQASTAGGSRSTGEIPVKIRFDYGGALVYPGMTATVTIYVTS